MTSNGGRLTPDTARVSLLETRAACCRNSPSQLGGQPCPSRAHSLSAWMATKRRLPWRMSPKSMAPRSTPWAPLEPASGLAITLAVRGHRKPNTASLALRLAPAATGSSGSYGKKTTTAGEWRLHSCPERPLIGSKRTVETLCHWLASLAQAISRRSMSPRSKMKPCARSPGLVKMPAVSSKTPHAVSKPFCSATISAPPAGPQVARPTCDGSLKLSVPRPRHKSLFTKTSARFRSLPHASNGSHKHSPSTCKPGVCPRWATLGRPCVACHARWPSPW
jgi:hypothetical protein